MSFVVRDAELADGRRRDVRVAGETIDAVAADVEAAPDDVEVDADGRLLLPGMIDAHVHFREPGASHKETWATGSHSAAAGGVTTAVDMPNTDPPTVDAERVAEKLALAEGASLVDVGVNGGVTADWDPTGLLAAPIVALGEVFLADSTGDMGITPDLFADAARAAADAGAVLTVHAEDADLFDADALPDESAGDGAVGRDADGSAWSRYRTPAAEVAAVETAIEVAADTGVRAHVAHASTPAGVDRAEAAGLTAEVTPHHLFLSAEDAAELGTYGRMNPPLRDEARRAALFERTAVPDGPVDVVATDHAPHTRAEKEAPLTEAPSGVPGVETALPLLLAAAARDEIAPERIRDLTAANPAAIFDHPRKGRIEPGRDADLVLVDPGAVEAIRAERLHSHCDWTPFEGHDGVFPEWTAVRGTVVYAAAEASLPEALAPDGPVADDGARFGEPIGENVR